VTRGEWEALRHVARQRNARNRGAGVADQMRARHRTSESIDRQGVLGEYAAIRIFAARGQVDEGAALSALLDTSLRCARTDYGGDVMLNNGDTVDVKTASFSARELRVHIKKIDSPVTHYLQLSAPGFVYKDDAFATVPLTASNDADPIFVVHWNLLATAEDVFARPILAESRQYYCISL